jgi:hypothetical protein
MVIYILITKEGKNVKKIIIGFVAFVVVAVSGLVFQGCWLFKKTDNGYVIVYQNDRPQVGIQRYNVYPVAGDYKYEHSWTENGIVDYYAVYLGKVTNVPIAYEAAVYFDGVNTVEATYTAGETTEGEISYSMSSCVEETIGSETIKEAAASIETCVDIGQKDIYQLGVKLGISVKEGSTSSNSKTNSLTETYTSFSRWSATNVREMKMSIGGNGKAVGYYRFTLFATCDVYVDIVVDSSSNEKYYEYMVCARGSTYAMMLDYSADNDFSRGNNTQNLIAPKQIITSLPAVALGADMVKRDLRTSSETVGTVSIPSNIKTAVFIGSATKNYTLDISINERNTDLNIVLSNMSIKAQKGKAGIKNLDTRQTISNTFKFELYGVNKVKGWTGVNGGQCGSGENGTASIDLFRGKIEIIGGGSLELIGGDGGNGGDGGVVNGGKSLRTGGNGGEGGDGLICLSAMFNSARGQITISGGKGGNGGNGKTPPYKFWLIPPAGGELDGGNGGNGGNGGYTIKTTIAPACQGMTLPLTVLRGVGGFGGEKGYKMESVAGVDGSYGANGITRTSNTWFNTVTNQEINF